MNMTTLHWLCAAAHRTRFAFTGGLASLALTLGATTALAAECLLPPVSVPGLYGAPQWYTSAGLSVRAELDDPRWGGAPITSFANDGVGTTAAYRALVYGDRSSLVPACRPHWNQQRYISTGPQTIPWHTAGSSASAKTPAVRSYREKSGLDYQISEDLRRVDWPQSATPPTGSRPSQLENSQGAFGVNERSIWGLRTAQRAGFTGFAMTVNNYGGSVSSFTRRTTRGTALAAGTLYPDGRDLAEYSTKGQLHDRVSLLRIIGTPAPPAALTRQQRPNFLRRRRKLPAPYRSQGHARFSIEDWGSTS